MRTAALITPFLLCALPAQEPRGDDFAQRLAAILPARGETSWRAVPWQPELRSALAQAQHEQKPILLWAMNGHPLGQC